MHPMRRLLTILTETQSFPYGIAVWYNPASKQSVSNGYSHQNAVRNNRELFDYPERPKDSVGLEENWAMAHGWVRFRYTTHGVWMECADAKLARSTLKSFIDTGDYIGQRLDIEIPVLSPVNHDGVADYWAQSGQRFQLPDWDAAMDFLKGIVRS
jgi:hypothetical protein